MGLMPNRIAVIRASQQRREEVANALRLQPTAGTFSPSYLTDLTWTSPLSSGKLSPF